MEIWNLVFMQFERRVDGRRGLRRSSRCRSRASTPAWGSSASRACSRARRATTTPTSSARSSTRRRSSRASATAARRRTTTSRCASSPTTRGRRRSSSPRGSSPTAPGVEYVLRRVMRRAIRHGHRLGIARPFLHEVAELRSSSAMGDAVPRAPRRGKELIVERRPSRRRSASARRSTAGCKILDEEIESMKARADGPYPGDARSSSTTRTASRSDLTEVIARGARPDGRHGGYEKALEEQRARSEGSKVGEAAVEDVWREALETIAERATCRVHRATTARRGRGRSLALVEGGAPRRDAADAGDEVAVVVDATPFYGEAGGQVGDRGRIESPRDGDCAFEVTRHAEAARPGSSCTTGACGKGSVARRRRGRRSRSTTRGGAATRRNHSATHLLHWALRTVLGEQAAQKGSLVGPGPAALRLLVRQGGDPGGARAHRGPREREGALERAGAHRGPPHRPRRARGGRWPSSRRSTATSCAS